MLPGLPGKEKEAMSKATTVDDVINHPSHYTYAKIEVIDYIEALGFNYHLGNVIKYLSRAGHKNPDEELTDLRKAQWYLNRYIDLLEKKEGVQ